MSEKKLDIRQSETRILQDQLNATAVTGMDSTLASINNELSYPGRIMAQTTPTRTVTIDPAIITNPNTGKHRILPLINNSPALSFLGGTVTFPATSGTIVVSPGVNDVITIGANQFVAVLVQLTSAGQIHLSVSAATGSIATLNFPISDTATLMLGYIVVQSDGSSQIQNITSSMIYKAVGGNSFGGFLNSPLDLNGNPINNVGAINFAAGTSITSTGTDIAISNHLRIGGPGGAQFSDDGTNLVLANRNFRIGLGGATLSNNGTDLLLIGGLSVSNQTGTRISSTATDIAIEGHLRVGGPGGAQLSDDGLHLVIANRSFEIGIGGAILDHNGADLLLLGGLSVSGQTGTRITSTATDLAVDGHFRIGGPGGVQLSFNIPLPLTPVMNVAGISAIELGVGIDPVHIWANGAGNDCDIGANNGHAFRYGYFGTSVQTQRLNLAAPGVPLNTRGAIFENGDELVIEPVSNIRLFSPAGPQLVYDGAFNEVKLGFSALMGGTGGGSFQLLWHDQAPGNSIGRLDNHRVYDIFVQNSITIGSQGDPVTFSATAGALRLENGATGLIEWRNAANTANYSFGLNASNQFEWTSAGSTIFSLSSTGQLLVSLGTDGAPSIATITDTNTGVSWEGGDTLKLVSGGSPKIFVLPTQVAINNAQLRVDNGSAAAPAYSWSTQTNMGLLKSTTDQMAASVTGIIVSYWGANYFGVERSYIGANLLNYVKNTDNTNGLSNAYLEAISGGASGGDAAVHFVINGVTDWIIGIDNSASDAFVISKSNILGTNNYFTITTSGDATFLGSNLTLQNLITFAAGTSISSTATDIAISDHLRIGGPGGAQLSDDGVNLVLANRAFRIGLGGATISNSGTTAIFNGSISVSGQTATSISSTATDIALNGNVRIGSPGGPQFAASGSDLILAGANLRIFNLAASSIVLTDVSNRLVASTVTPTQLTYLQDVEPLTSFTLVDATASPTNVATWAFASFSSIQIDYSINGGATGMESGKILLITDGTSAGIAQTFATVSSTGVAFTVDINGANIRLRYTKTATGSNATMKYKVQKWLA